MMTSVDNWLSERSSLITAGSAIATLITASAALVAVCLTSRQVDILEGEQRPYIDAPEITADMSDGKPELKFVFKNVGRSITVGLVVRAEITRGANALQAIDQLCEQNKAEIQKNYSMIPGGKFEILNADLPLSLNSDELGSTPDQFIVGCVSYGSPFDNSVHRTGFRARVRKVADSKIEISTVYTINPN